MFYGRIRMFSSHYMVVRLDDLTNREADQPKHPGTSRDEIYIQQKHLGLWVQSFFSYKTR